MMRVESAHRRLVRSSMFGGAIATAFPPPLWGRDREGGTANIESSYHPPPHPSPTAAPPSEARVRRGQHIEYSRWPLALRARQRERGEAADRSRSTTGTSFDFEPTKTRAPR